MNNDLLRFMKYVQIDPVTRCWLWTGATRQSKTDIYGQFSYQGRNLSAHRVSYLLFKGEIPDGVHVHHSCETTLCVNPSCIHVKTPKEHTHIHNGPAAKNALKTHCKRGHLFDEANTVIDKKGRRSCRECARLRVRAWYNKQHPDRQGRTGRPKGSGLITHCKRGHPFDEANTITEKTGSRRCRICKNNRQRGLNRKR